MVFLKDHEEQIITLTRILETGNTQNDLIEEKIQSGKIQLENYKLKIERQKRLNEEQLMLKETLETEMTENESKIVELGQIIKLNDKFVSGVQNKGYELIKKKVRLAMDASFGNRQFDFVEKFVSINPVNQN